eukprot:GHVP01003418.1.p1 GENE.GHVP01003418.1~~GHVP01003418.1.p1  ORF type:complete len:489 (-),score=52.73 GHVP01003418.1:66-1511(-)
MGEVNSFYDKMETPSSLSIPASLESFWEVDVVDGVKENIKYRQRRELSSSPPAPKFTLTLMSVILIGAGTCNSLLIRLQNRQFVPYNQECLDSNDIASPPPPGWDEYEDGIFTCWNYFYAPIWQTFLMSFSEWWCQWIWLINVIYTRLRNLGRPKIDLARHSKSLLKPRSPVGFWLIPFFFGWFASIMIHQAYALSYTQTIELTMSLRVAFIAFFSVFQFYIAIRTRHLIGCVLLTGGLIISSMYGILNPYDEYIHFDAVKAFIGVLLGIIATLLHTFQQVYLEHLTRKYFVSPFEGVGWMGLFGIIFSGIFLLFLEFLAPYQDEKTSATFFNARYKRIIITAQICSLFSNFLFSGSGMTVTKHGGSLLRSVLTTSRVVFVWIVELSIQWNTFDTLSFCGMLLVSAGSLIYLFDILWIPCPKVKTFCNKPVICTSKMKDPDEISTPGAEENKDPKPTEESNSKPDSNDKANPKLGSVEILD